MESVVHAFRLLGDEIKSLKDQLVTKERLAVLGEVSAGIAHEFRNPMGVIAGYARLLLKSFDENDMRREIVQGILKEIDEMNRVMEELLKFSKSEPIKKDSMDITKVIKDVIQSFAKTLINQGKKIEFALKDGIAIKADETLLRQAIRNLIQNALDAGDRVWINIEKGAYLNKEGVFIDIKDNGSGMSEDNLSKIFMPFYTTKNGGSGIGLALAQKIIMGHGGNISVESKEGEGSLFRLFLPME
jgi:signal transduction histidine kinase